MFAGNGVGQILALASVPVIARLFDPAAVGSFGLFASVVAALAVVSCLALDQAIPVAESRQEAQALEAVSALVLAGFVGLLAAVVLAAQAFGLGRLEGLGPHLLLLPPAVLIAGLAQISIQSATQRHDFTRLSRGFAVRTGGTALAQIAVFLVMPDGTGLILAQMVAVTLALFVLGGPLRGGIPSWPDLRATLARHGDCPRFLAPRLMVGSAGDVAILLLLSAWFPTSEVGFYWMANRLLQVPGGFIDPPTRQLFMSAAKEAQMRTGRFGSVLITAQLGLMGVAGGVILTLVLFGHPLIRTVLGEAWDPAVAYVQILSVGWAFEFMMIPSSNAVLLLGMQRQHFWFDVALRTALLAGLAVGCWYGDLLLGCVVIVCVKAVMIGSFAAYLIARALSPEPVALSGAAT